MAICTVRDSHVCSRSAAGGAVRFGCLRAARTLLASRRAQARPWVRHLNGKGMQLSDADRKYCACVLPRTSFAKFDFEAVLAEQHRAGTVGRRYSFFSSSSVEPSAQQSCRIQSETFHGSSPITSLASRSRSCTRCAPYWYCVTACAQASRRIIPHLHLLPSFSRAFTACIAPLRRSRKLLETRHRHLAPARQRKRG